MKLEWGTSMPIWGVLVAFTLCLLKPVYSSDFEGWLKSQKAQMLQDLMRNLSEPGIAPGVVIASPSRSQPDYFYDWTRDGAITMLELVRLYAQESNSDLKQAYFKRIMDYVDSARMKQLTPNMSGGVSDKGNGEPKWNVDLTAFNKDWGRPQNDGPALRARTLIEFSNILLKEGRGDIVKKLYDGKIPSESVIKADLEFVSHRWRESSYELWEEVNGDHFSTRRQSRRALLMGANLARTLGDEGAAKWYEKQADELRIELNKHWRSDLQYFIQTINRVGGVDDKISNLDIAILIASLDEDKDPEFKIIDDKILATAEALRSRMQSVYDINKIEKDSAGEKMGTALGRYIEDRYDGFSNQGRGNPWYLITSTGANLSYEFASAWIDQKYIEISDLNLPFFQGWLDLNGLGLKPGEIINIGDSKFTAIIDAAIEAGHGFMRRWRFHSGLVNNPHEQMNRDTGYRQGAAELTWNCASFLATMNSLDKLKKKLKNGP